MRVLTDESLNEFAIATSRDPDGLKNLEAKQTSLAAHVRSTLERSKRAHADVDLCKARVSELCDALSGLRNEQTAAINKALPEALKDRAADFGKIARQLEGFRGRIQFLQDLVEYGRRIELPKLHLEKLKVDAEMFESAGELLNLNTEVSAVERALAARELAKAEGIVVFPQTGRTFDLLKASWEMFDKVDAAKQALDDEIKRQAKLANRPQ